MPEAFVYNLAHDHVAAFDRATDTMTLTSVGDCQAVTLSKRAQLLLLDALCSAYSFPSPVADIVTKQLVGEQEDVEVA